MIIDPQGRGQYRKPCENLKFGAFPFIKLYYKGSYNYTI